MKSIVNCLVLAIVGVLLISHYGEVNCAPKLSASILKAWDEFKASNGKLYDTEEEAEKRLGIFAQNFQSIQEHNERFEKGEETYEQGITQFADLTEEEFKEQYLTAQEPSENFLSSQQGIEIIELNDTDYKLGYPTTLNLTSMLGSIRNQTQCGSCWAFSTLAALEAAYKKKYNTLIDFSEQQLVNCDPYNNGCNGGWMSNAFYYILTNGIKLESQYPYTGIQSQCPSSSIRTPGTYKNFSAYKNKNTLTVAETKEYLYYHGIQSIAMDANSLKNYKKGIISGSACSKINHAVNLVGYGSNFWIARNSWGSAWGENGYFRMAMNSANNDCFFRNYLFFAKFL